MIGIRMRRALRATWLLIPVLCAAGLTGCETTSPGKPHLTEGVRHLRSGRTHNAIESFNPGGDLHVVVIDCGVKRNIVESLVQRGVSVTVVPYGTPYADISALKPDGIVVSPGPGDPATTAA